MSFTALRVQLPLLPLNETMVSVVYGLARLPVKQEVRVQLPSVTPF